MNHKVFRSVFVLAVAIGLASVVSRVSDAPKKPLPALAPADSVSPESRALASYRVQESPSDAGAGFLGANYRATLTEKSFVFGGVPEAGSRSASREFSVEFGAPRIEQGQFQLECAQGRISRTAHGIRQIDRGAVIEEYVLENRRAEQSFRFPAPLGEGALRVCIPLKSDLGGQVVSHPPQEEGFKDFRFLKGGLAFCDALGETKLAYHSAVVIDAENRQLALMPRYERSEIVLEVPAEFMNRAAYPVVIDPWLDMGVGISTGFHAAQRPALAKFGSGSFYAGTVAWSDNSTGNFEIYAMAFNGNDFVPFGTSGSPGGISLNPGMSVNPSIVLDSQGRPMIAWEDDSAGSVSIYCRHWNPLSKSWDALGTSASETGISGNLAANRHPSVSYMTAQIPGQVTVNPSNGQVTSDPTTYKDCPVITWDSGASVYCSAFYPGAPAIPPVTVGAQAFSAVPSGWYQLGTAGGVGVNVSLFNPGATVDGGIGGLYPAIAVDRFGRPGVAFQTTASGNYQVAMKRWTNGAAVFNYWQVVANATNAGFDISPGGNFTTITGAAGPGIIGTAGYSQYPSIAVDAPSNFTVAWQETELAGTPLVPIALPSQIYAARSVAGGAFAAMGSSLSALGISKTTALATTPSVDVAGGYATVAWADTSNSQSSIYVRRFVIGGAGIWEQVGFQGSAFPPAFLGEIAPIGGVSQSPNYAIQPQVSVSSNGDPSVVWADGGSALFNIKGKQFVGNAPGTAVGLATTNPTFAPLVQQSSTDPAVTITPIAPGDFSVNASVWLFARVFTETLTPASLTLRLEIEIQPAGTPFTGRPNVPQTPFVTPDSPTGTLGLLATIKYDGLPNFNYHWRARTVDESDRASPWVSPGEVGGVSFRINAAATSGGGSNGPSNTVALQVTNSSKSKCGLTGLEAVALLGALRFLRRRRSK